MGWSLDTVRPELDAIFNNLGLKYSMSHPDSPVPTVIIRHEGEIDIKVLRSIVEIFPNFVYVNFMSSMTMVENPAEEH